MKLVKTLLAAAALTATVGAQAAVAGSKGGGFGTFLDLSSAGLNGGSVATLSGGTVYTSDQPFADIPKGGVFGGDFLAAGPTSTSPATLTFAGGGIDYISFLWGSPDTFNTLTVGSTAPGATSQVFTAMDLSIPATGDQTFSQYVQFMGVAGSKITSLSFSSSIDAFETANYSVTPVPEPETYALMLAGLGAMGFIARRRQKG